MDNEIDNLKSKVDDLEDEKEDLEKKLNSCEDNDNSYSSNSTLKNTDSDKVDEVVSSLLPNKSSEDLTESSKAVVVFKDENCQYFLLQQKSNAYIIAQWLRYDEPQKGDVLVGNFNSNGSNDFQIADRGESFIYIEGSNFSRDEAFDFLTKECLKGE